MSHINNEPKNKNIHAGHRARMRDKLLKSGIDVFTDHELLEFLMYYIHRTKDTNPIGHALIDRFGSIGGVFSASYEELIKVDGISDAGAAFIIFVSQLADRVSRSEIPKKAMLSSYKESGEYCMQYFKGLRKERFVLVCLDSERRVISSDIISEGSSNATVVDIRKIVEIAMNKGACGVVLSHNHPGDSTHPSSADVAVTARIINVLEGINISVIDHIICNGETYTSMSERGILDSL